MYAPTIQYTRLTREFIHSFIHLSHNTNRIYKKMTTKIIIFFVVCVCLRDLANSCTYVQHKYAIYTNLKMKLFY